MAERSKARHLQLKTNWTLGTQSQRGVISKIIKTRLAKPTEAADVNKGEHIDPRLMTEKPALDWSRQPHNWSWVSEKRSRQSVGPRRVEHYLFFACIGFWEPIPHGRMFSQPAHMEEDLGPARDNITDSENPSWKPLSSLGSWRGIECSGELGGLGIVGGEEGEGPESDFCKKLNKKKKKWKRDNRCQPRLLYPTKLSITVDVENKPDLSNTYPLIQFSRKYQWENSNLRKLTTFKKT